MENYSININKKLINSWERDLRKLINNWDMIPGSLKDEFDRLNHKLISHLTKGVNEQKIFDILRSELITNYGLLPTEIELDNYTDEIIDWWNSNR